MELNMFDNEVKVYGDEIYKAVVKEATEECAQLFIDKEDPVKIIYAINVKVKEIFDDQNRIKGMQLSNALGL